MLLGLRVNQESCPRMAFASVSLSHATLRRSLLQRSADLVVRPPTRTACGSSTTRPRAGSPLDGVLELLASAHPCGLPTKTKHRTSERARANASTEQGARRHGCCIIHRHVSRTIPSSRPRYSVPLPFESSAAPKAGAGGTLGCACGGRCCLEDTRRASTCGRAVSCSREAGRGSRPRLAMARRRAGRRVW
jgi:hypothetical protein